MYNSLLVAWPNVFFTQVLKNTCVQRGLKGLANSRKIHVASRGVGLQLPKTAEGFGKRHFHLFNNSFEMNTETFVDLMLCVVCYILPRNNRIYTCMDCGNVVCGSCGDQIQARAPVMCPMCRSPRLIINKHLERLLPAVREVTTVSCQFEPNGCWVTNLASVIDRHEEGCGKRVVKCPAGHWKGGCKWRGIWDSALRVHMQDKECLQFFQMVKSGETVKSQVLFDSPSLDSQGTRHWKPLLVVIEIDGSNEAVYINISRTSTGLWTLMPRCYAPSYVKKRITLGISVTSARKDGVPFSPRDGVSYTGSVISHHVSNRDALDSGHSLLMTDAHVK